MGKRNIDVLGMGHAIVDVVTHSDDEYLASENLVKAAMTLIDADRAAHLYETMGPAMEVSGGIAANTVVGVTSMGGTAAFIGRVFEDQLGAIFRHDLVSTGVVYETPPATSGLPTGRCLIFVTPDGERTMNTFLGAAAQLDVDDIEDELIEASAITYIEGYLWDSAARPKAIPKTIDVAHSAGKKISISLSDSFLVQRHHSDLLDTVSSEVDVLFGNEQELHALLETEDLDQAIEQARDLCEIVVVTRSEKGSVVVSGRETHMVSAITTGPVVDTTGAGDLYASGFLFGLTHGFSLEKCARLATLAATEIISHLGGRPLISLSKLVSQV